MTRGAAAASDTINPNFQPGRARLAMGCSEGPVLTLTKTGLSCESLPHFPDSARAGPLIASG